MTRNLLTKHVATVLNHQKDPIKALQIFNSVKTKDGFTHNLTTYISIIQNLGNHNEFAAMEDMLTQMRSHINNQSLEQAYIFAMKCYGRNGKIQEAVNVFERMDFYNCDPGVSSYNVIMNILVEFGYFDQAHKVYMRMKDRNIFPDVYTFVIRIKSFCKRKRSVAAVRLLNNMYAYGFGFNSVAYCTVVGGLYEEGNRADARKVFDEMLEREVEPSVVSYNCLIGFWSKRGEFTRAKRLFDEMVCKGKRPNAVSYGLLMEALCSVGKFKEAKKMMFDMEYRGCKPRLVNYGVLMNDLAKRGNFDEARSLLNDMKKRRIKPDVVMYNILINYLCKESKVEEAYKKLVEMQVNGFEPNAATYRMIVDGYCNDGKFDEGLKVLNAMLMSRHCARLETFCCLIIGLVNNGKVDDACFVMEEMMKRRMSPDFSSWEALVASTCGEDKSARLLVSEAVSSSV